ncbi:hypothetical protein [Methanogenium organophilum]|uniref:Uncharacterized protein n=1 Tax=Methanogenium organophilum TaxID=2199 RepID=A0A9X9S553_METOG|nr:hypothetical protein [Methanogenium organophilum]WAI01100.1 hypothetical protein OU421_11860 [Methanogenium organophilum]
MKINIELFPAQSPTDSPADNADDRGPNIGQKRAEKYADDIKRQTGRDIFISLRPGALHGSKTLLLLRYEVFFG